MKRKISFILTIVMVMSVFVGVLIKHLLQVTLSHHQPQLPALLEIVSAKDSLLWGVNAEPSSLDPAKVKIPLLT